MKHSNISVFVPHAGCPHKCSFCDQRTISGAQHQPTAGEVREICEKALNEVPDRKNCEIAFFGGSFTAIDRKYMLSLLEAAKPYVGVDRFKGIRISTRPDFIDREVLDILKAHGVTAIELGAQSMTDKVLEANERGHTAQDVRDASALIREYGFELGLQMMVGLYKSDHYDEEDTVDEIIAVHPDTVRIYPVVVLKGTRLAELYESGEYILRTFDSIVSDCAEFIEKFEKNNIRVIKCGLHASEFVEQDMVAGYYHPAFRELCESFIYLDAIDMHIQLYVPRDARDVTITVNPSCISKARGHKNSNIKHFREQEIELKIIGDEKVPKYEVGFLTEQNGE